MKKLFLSIILLPIYLCSLGSTFTIDQKIFIESAGCSGFKHITNYITNNSPNSITLGWYVIENSLPLPECWTYIICDMKQCFNGIPQDGSDNMGSLTSGNSVELFDLGINTNGYTGNGILKLYVYNMDDNTHGDTVVFNISGCDSGSACPPLSIKGINAFSFIHIYPNPVRDVIYIENSNNSQFTNVSLFDIYGNKLKGFTQNGSSCNISLCVSDLDAGVYFVRIEAPDKLYFIKKIIKE
jgi:hypothetical protein